VQELATLFSTDKGKLREYKEQLLVAENRVSLMLFATTLEGLTHGASITLLVNDGGVFELTRESNRGIWSKRRCCAFADWSSPLFPFPRGAVEPASRQAGGA
jgi:hypothetical protein